MDTTSKTLQLNTSDGKMDAYVAQPKDGGPYPGIVVIQEAFGVNDHIKKVTDRIAAEGYVAIAPDIFHREAERVIPYSEMPKAIATLQRVQDPKAMEDVGAAIAHLKAESNVKGGSIGVVGFCMGGRLTYLTAAHHANDIKARCRTTAAAFRWAIRARSRAPARSNVRCISFSAPRIS